jgi:hypothetical protein
VKPFCALDRIKSRHFYKRLFKTLDTTLYKQLRSEIGRHLPIFVVSPFFGIMRILAVRKVWVRLPLRVHNITYLCKGILSKCQNFFIKQLLRPSIPAALLFPCFTEMSNSAKEIGDSSSCASLLGIYCYVQSCFRKFPVLRSSRCSQSRPLDRPQVSCKV